MQRIEDPQRTIRVPARETLELAFPANPTTGYTWQLDVDSSHLALVDETFETSRQGVGAGGKQVFQLRPQSAGETRVVCRYQRPWEGKAREERVLQVVIE